MQTKKRVGVITLPFTPNYGWLLQVYALQRMLEKLGYEPILIYRKWDKTKQNSGIINALKRWIYYHVLCRKLYIFFEKNFFKTKLYRDVECLKSVVDDYKLDAVIVGSDQVWRFENTRGAGYNFFLDFVVSENVSRIAYAASFGVDCWTGTVDELYTVRQLLKRFKAVSVRETTGVTLCRDVLNVKALLVLDPTLLLTSIDYNSLIRKNSLKSQETLSTYILDPSVEKDKLINNIALKKHLCVKSLYIDNRKGKIHTYSSLQYWLSGIRDAEYVVVDSFHGMVFSIIFKKNFLVLANKHRGLTRFESLLMMLGLKDRLVYDIDNIDYNIINQNIDYAKVDKLLEQQRNLSINFLRTNID
ncbi:MAG TPA: polysaccharide pyruvyl transferase family protein [Candidatus Phocaeicola gallistercoris]|nr:polysaccharide pyruvyl transferase family protein [Candidatus Phocaeicola gallistercoris]